MARAWQICPAPHRSLVVLEIQKEQIVPKEGIDDDSNVSTEPSQPSQHSSCSPLSEELLTEHHPHPDTPIIGRGRAKTLGYRWFADITLRALFQRFLYKWKRLNTKTDMNGATLPPPYTSEVVTASNLSTWRMLKPSTRVSQCPQVYPPGPMEWAYILGAFEEYALGKVCMAGARGGRAPQAKFYF